MKKKLEVIILLLLSAVLLTGCWDKVEIEDRAFVMAIGIDLSSSSTKRYVVTFQFPNAAQIAKGTSGGGGGSERPSFAVSEVADTIFSASRHISTRLNKALYLGHTQVIILGKDVGEDRDKFQQVLDSLDRSYELSRKLRLLVTPQRAQDILLKKYEIEPNTGAYIRDIFKQYNRTSIFPSIDYNKIIKSLHETNGNAIIPKIVAGKEDIKIAGSAIIKNYRLVGWMEDDENMGYMWLTGLVKGGDVSIIMPGDGENIKVPFNISNVSRRRSVKEENGKIVYEVKLEVEGDITEYTFEKHGKMMETNVLNVMEKKTSERIKQMTKKAIDRFQKDLKVDMLGVGDYIEKHNPTLWEKVGKNWNDIFPDIEIKVDVSSHVRRIGLFR
ncbi:spore germination protein GerLC [Thermoanaerobacter kivui]|uniref:Spore germination protein GerLC n=1 Tax=Thermoanaerobacter kivui TaxID=2325 RepID=A0A097AUD1_THEKI|nr:Ger(x)C family spore germination protein [Thermoanaerobacter kivui]AIS53413.1 spore germination protein GerLC [Thermoanaerobacter kivui]